MIQEQSIEYYNWMNKNLKGSPDIRRKKKVLYPKNIQCIHVTSNLLVSSYNTGMIFHSHVGIPTHLRLMKILTHALEISYTDLCNKYCINIVSIILD